jgi:uncharacterized protein (DUF736 family)
MPQIGAFTRNDDGFFGEIRTLTLHARLTILPAEKSAAENAPDHRIFHEGTEVGAAWERTGEKASSYLSVVHAADPRQSLPVRCRKRRMDAALEPLVEARRTQVTPCGEPVLARRRVDRQIAHLPRNPHCAWKGWGRGLPTRLHFPFRQLGNPSASSALASSLGFDIPSSAPFGGSNLLEHGRFVSRSPSRTLEFPSLARIVLFHTPRSSVVAISAEAWSFRVSGDRWQDKGPRGAARSGCWVTRGYMAISRGAQPLRAVRRRSFVNRFHEIRTSRGKRP